MRAPVVIAVWMSFCLCTLAGAQDFRVTTRLYDERDSQAATEPIAHSWSIFHAGKVYDHVDIVGETTVYDPAQKRFIIVHPGRMIATLLPFDDIDRLLHQSVKRAQQRINADPNNPKNAAIAFQVAPAFQETFEEKAKRLQLVSPHFRYDVKTADAADDRRVAYLKYADWAAKLNYILHPQLLPNARMKLNESLDKHQRIPTEIRLQSKIGNGLQLRAEHKFQWELMPQDRRQITETEAVLQNPRLKMLEFDEFQETLAAR